MRPLARLLKTCLNTRPVMPSAPGCLKSLPTTASTTCGKKRSNHVSIDGSFNDDKENEPQIHLKDETPDPEEHLIRSQKVVLMRTVVQKLKPRYRTLIELRYFKEYSYEEISEELDLPLGTVKAQLFRARELLYNTLKNSEVKR